jgi:hypothetical protein
MSKATSLNNLEHMDPNISQEVDRVLAEVEASKNNQVPPPQIQQQMPQQPQVIQQMPPMQGQQLPPPQQIPPPPQQMQQMPPQQREYVQNMDPNFVMPNFYNNQKPQGNGIFDFLQSFLFIGDELKWVGILVGLFFFMNQTQTINFLSKYLTFTIDELGNSTMVGTIARGLILSVFFVLINKFL